MSFSKEFFEKYAKKDEPDYYSLQTSGCTYDIPSIHIVVENKTGTKDAKKVTLVAIIGYLVTNQDNVVKLLKRVWHYGRGVWALIHKQPTE